MSQTPDMSLEPPVQAPRPGRRGPLPKPRAKRRSTRTKPHRSGLQDIADQLNVSLSLVSKVLSGKLGTSGASPALAKAIQDKASELNYRKNATATSLATGRQSAIGVYIHRHGVAGSNIAASLVEGIAAAAMRRQQRLVLQYYTTAPELANLMSLAHRNVVDGLILGGVPHRHLIDQVLAARRDLPLVTAHSGQNTLDFVNIGVDQPEVLRVATQHLIDRGCRRIACVNNATEFFRIKGYRGALTDAGFEHDERLVFPGGDYLAATGEAAARHWLARGVEFDGIVGQSDQHIAGVVKVLLEAGIRIPQQVKLIGVDNSPFCEFFVVPLSSVSQEEFRRGELAVETLLDAIDSKPIQSRNVAPVVHARRSSE